MILNIMCKVCIIRIMVSDLIDFSTNPLTTILVWSEKRLSCATDNVQWAQRRRTVQGRKKKN
jgi:hypothetical protein